MQVPEATRVMKPKEKGDGESQVVVHRYKDGQALWVTDK